MDDQKQPNQHWPVLLVASVFVLCVAAVIAGIFHQDTGSTILQLMILAGLVVGFIDRHFKQQEAVQKINENTAITTQAAQEVKAVGENAAKVDSVVTESKEAAKQVASVAKIAALETTKAVADVAQKTEAIAEKINGRMEELIEVARRAAFAEGVLKGQEDERQRHESSRPVL